MRLAAVLARLIGWLLTPFVVWAASFLGAWLVLGTAAEVADPRSALITTFGIALVAGAITFLLWRQVLRRSPRLRKSLQVTEEGLPDLEGPAAPEAPEPPPSSDKPA
jgi:hypothetical protein